jgi:transcriptional regulator GlxA family with amidase domain
MTPLVDFLPVSVQAGGVATTTPDQRPHRPIRKVSVVVQDGAEPFGLGAMCEVWAEPYHPEDDNPVFDFSVVTPRPGRVRGASGYDLHVEHGLEHAADADLVCVSPKRSYLDPSPEVAELLRHAHGRGAYVFAHCTGAFVLGESGLLDGRRCTTHWRHVDELVERHPEAIVEADSLYVQDGTIVTGAGSAAGLDAALHLVRQQFGARVAATTARRMVVPPHRDGGQAQYVVRPVPVCESEALAPLLAWISDHLGDELSVEQLAARMHMSPRTFARRFKEETGTTPYSWVLAERVRAAQELLEQTNHSVEWIAGQVGFSNAATLRHHFARSRGVSPQDYRRTFRTPA